MRFCEADKPLHVLHRAGVGHSERQLTIHRGIGGVERPHQRVEVEFAVEGLLELAEFGLQFGDW